jgi:hypothetical protein
MSGIYLDYQSAMPMDPRVLEFAGFLAVLSVYRAKFNNIIS